MSEELDIRTCIICGKENVPIFVLIKKDGTMTFLNKSEVVILELSKENFDYLNKVKSVHIDTVKQVEEKPSDMSYHSVPQSFKVITERSLVVSDINIVATIPNEFNLDTIEQKELTIPEKLGFLIVLYTKFGVVKSIEILDKTCKTLEEVKKKLILNRTTNIVSYAEFIDYMEFPKETQGEVMEADYDHYLNFPDEYVTGQIFTKKYIKEE